MSACGTAASAENKRRKKGIGAGGEGLKGRSDVNQSIALLFQDTNCCLQEK